MPAEFYKGVVFERGASARLTIEGNPIEYGDEGPFTATLPRPTESGATEVSGETLSELAQQYIEHSGLLESRESEKKKHLEELRQGSKTWNTWRRANPLVQPMLAGLTVDEWMSLKSVDLKCCDFSYANLCQAQLQGLDLKRGNFHQAILAKADLSDAHLEEANFCRTDFYDTILRRAHLNGANLQGVQFARTDLTGAQLTGCKVYGLSAWDLTLDGATEGDLIIRYRPTAERGEQEEEEVRVQSPDLAAFMYLTLNNRNISRIIGETTSRWVLLLGRFSEGKSVLTKLKEVLLTRDHLIPVIFDFPRPQDRDLLETINLLGGLSMCVVAEISDPRSAPMEVLTIASTYGVPIFPIIKKGEREVATFGALRRFTWVHKTLEYDPGDDESLKQLGRKIVRRARAMRNAATQVHG